MNTENLNGILAQYIQHCKSRTAADEGTIWRAVDCFGVNWDIDDSDFPVMFGDAMQQAKQALIDQKPLVQAYVIDQVRDKMIGGEAAVGVIYSGEMLYIQEEVANQGADFTLEYVLPEEGTNLWLDCWVIPKNAKNKENAEKWLDFLCRPEIAKANFEYITYPTPNKGAFELLDEEMQNNKAVFPDIDSLKNCEVFKYMGDKVDSVYNELWKEVKAN